MTGHWDRLTSSHTMTIQVVILLHALASYLFLQVSQPGMPAEESRKQEVW